MHHQNVFFKAYKCHSQGVVATFLVVGMHNQKIKHIVLSQNQFLWQRGDATLKSLPRLSIGFPHQYKGSKE